MHVDRILNNTKVIMLIVLEEHVLGNEGDAWYLLLYQMTLET